MQRMAKEINKKLGIFADLTLTNSVFSLHVLADGQRIILKSNSVFRLLKSITSLKVHSKLLRRTDSFLYTGKVGVYITIGFFSIPLLGFGSWDWLKKLVPAG